MEFFEAAHWDAGRTTHKLQQPSPLLERELCHCLPEVLDRRVGCLKAGVGSIFTPVLDVNLRETPNKELQLLLVKHLQQRDRHNRCQAFKEAGV